jgi:UDP-hydrolysing UDP-N-acetyl-D-glucosamine 2-epimerase
MRTIGAVTTSRADYGIYRPVLQRIKEHPDLELMLFVGGMHLSPEFGLTVNEIEADGFYVTERVEMLLASDTPEGIAKSMGLGTIGFAQAFARSRPDVLLVLGDRFEMHSAALAALPFNISIAHIHGGEITEGAIDDALRHCITKLSHLHFVATEDYEKRVIQLGEEPWRVLVSGAPSLDNLGSLEFLSREHLEAQFGLRLSQPPLLVTFHPVTLEYEQAEWQVVELIGALRESGLPVVITMPNADTGGRVITRLLEEFAEDYPQAQMVKNMGTQAYFSLMAIAAAMVGNSSSGIIEAPSLQLPAVNVGNRQRGRTRAMNVIDVGYCRNEILAGIQQSISPDFRDSLRDLVNPYGNGQASGLIVERLNDVNLDQQLITKRFVDTTSLMEQLA